MYSEPESMWRKKNPEIHSVKTNVPTVEFNVLLQYITQLASHKLGYPVSLLTYLGIIDNKSLGIRPHSLANVLLNNVGDPFKDSETSLMEVKKHEREIISILEKYYGLEDNGARGYVTTGGTEGNFAGLWWSKRYLINSEIDELIKYDNIIKLQIKEEKSLTASLSKVAVHDYETRASVLQKIVNLKNTIAEYKNIVQELLTPTVFFTKGHTHYSIAKIAEIVRLNIRTVAACDDGAMDMNDLKKELILNLGAHPYSPIIIIANIGTTITGAIDDVPSIKKILEELPEKPKHTIHLDGALTGFIMPIIKPFGNVANYFDAIGVNSLAVSAHKYPGLSQPCGIILAKRIFFEKAFEKSERSIDYVGNILDVTITGSRSGLNVLMFYNALYTLGLNKNTDVLSEMIKENFKNASYLRDELIKIFGPDKVSYPYHFNVSFPRPSRSLARKYQLMLTGDKATICVLTNVTKELIDQFLSDLIIDIKENAMTDKKTDYTIVSLANEHMKSAIDLFVKCFCHHEPATKFLNMQRYDFEPFASEVIHKAVNDGLSKVAIDSNKRVVALIIAEDIADPFIPKISHYPKMKPVISVLDKLSKPFLKGKKFIRGAIAHYWIAAVDPEYRSQGLFIAITAEAIKLAAKKGYNFAYAEFTNEISEKITHQFNVVQQCNKILYDTFTADDNTMPFKGLSGYASAYVATIRSGAKLSSLSNSYKVEEKY